MLPMFMYGAALIISAAVAIGCYMSMHQPVPINGGRGGDEQQDDEKKKKLAMLDRLLDEMAKKEREKNELEKTYDWVNGINERVYNDETASESSKSSFTTKSSNQNNDTRRPSSSVSTVSVKSDSSTSVELLTNGSSSSTLSTVSFSSTSDELSTDSNSSTSSSSTSDAKSKSATGVRRRYMGTRYGPPCSATRYGKTNRSESPMPSSPAVPECFICLDSFDQFSLSCGHTVHPHCIRKVLNKDHLSNTCRVCDIPFSFEDIVKCG